MKKFIMWIEKYSIPLRIIYEVLVVSLPLLLSSEVREFILSKRINDSYGTIVFWGALVGIIFLVVIRVVITQLKKTSVTKLSEVNNRMNNQINDLNAKVAMIEKVVPSALHGILESLRSELSLGNDDRISLYLVEVDKNPLQYFCCERCSTNLEHEKKCSRMRPLVKMFKKIWDEGRLYDDRFPKITKKSRADYDAYCKRVYGLSSNDVQNINFHGRTYWGARIDYKGEHLAFIVISSLVKGIAGKSEEEIDAIVKPSCQKLGAVIQAFKRYIPSPYKVEDVEEF